MALTDEDVREILRLIDESGLDELKIDMEGFSLHVRRGGNGFGAGEEVAPPRVAPRAAAAPVPPGAPATPAAAAADAAAPAATATATADGPTVDAPMLGTFYRAEAPGRAPFVEVGTEVEPGTVVCLIEVMKMMNSIEAGVAGTIVEVCAENAALVEYGQPLFRIRPGGSGSS
jgi:acetyl-CoA carboxylase biotin carboxyl carrier protein